MAETLYLLLALINVSPGETEELIIDHSLTYEDCQARLETGPIFTKPVLRKLQDITMICEPEE